MKNSKDKKFTCKGINNALAILGSNRFNIISIDILKDGRADRNPRLKDLIYNHLVFQLSKDQFFKKAFNQNVLPMKAYLDYNGKNQMDYVIRYENLSQQLVDVCKKIDIPFNKFEATNVSKHPHYSHFYDDKILYEIENLYREDIREFNYEFEDER